MAREIKFRGLRTDGKGWVEGDLAHGMAGAPMIMPKCFFATRDFLNEDEKGNPILEKEMALGGFVFVIPETVGQFTGLKDKNGVDIYAGDELNPISQNLTYVVVFKDAQFGLESKIGYWGCLRRYFELSEKHDWSCEVIGNIHEKEVSNG